MQDMPFKCTAGEITNSHAKVDVQWKITEFQRLCNKMCADEYIESPDFYFFKARWCLRLFPCGDSQSIGWIAVCLSVKSFSDGMMQCPITFTLSFRDYNKEIKRGKETHHIFQHRNPSYGWTKIIQRLHLTTYTRVDFLNLSFLTVYCNATANISIDAACQTSGCSLPFFCNDFRDLLASGRKSDVTIKVDDQEFKTHRWILENCSPVFSAMFENDMSEKHEGIVDIYDCDPNVFSNFLQCIYTGKVENLLPENVLSLYVVADKYCVNHLKEKCAELLAEEISVDSACNILVLAERYEETKLQKSAEDFILQNIQTIPKVKWSWLMSENSLLAAEILTKKVFHSEQTEDNCESFTWKRESVF